MRVCFSSNQKPRTSPTKLSLVVRHPLLNDSFRVYNWQDDPWVVRVKFWKRFAENKWESHTLALFRLIVGSETTVVDFGAWIGPTVLFNAHLAKRVICFEPDVFAYNILNLNLQLNPKLSPKVEAHLGSICHRPGLTTIQASFGNSVSSFMAFKSPLLERKMRSRSVALPTMCHNLCNVLEEISGPSVVKIDIEGFEMVLLPHLGACVELWKPKVFVAFHPQLVDIPNVRELTYFAKKFTYICWPQRLSCMFQPEIRKDLFRGEVLFSFENVYETDF